MFSFSALQSTLLYFVGISFIFNTLKCAERDQSCEDKSCAKHIVGNENRKGIIHRIFLYILAGFIVAVFECDSRQTLVPGYIVSLCIDNEALGVDIVPRVGFFRRGVSRR